MPKGTHNNFIENKGGNKAFLTCISEREIVTSNPETEPRPNQAWFWCKGTFSGFSTATEAPNCFKIQFWWLKQNSSDAQFSIVSLEQLASLSRWITFLCWSPLAGAPDAEQDILIDVTEEKRGIWILFSTLSWKTREMIENRDRSNISFLLIFANSNSKWTSTSSTNSRKPPA